jgi:G3E family GTPase
MNPTFSPIPFYILCGSLGAGKTTLLMRLLEYWKAQGRRAGVLMNEAGNVSIDGPRAGTLAEQVMNLAGGCVCCDTKEDLSWGIAQLVRDHGSDVLILECSGLADPAEVVDAVTDAYTARLASLERVIALLHPVSTEESHSSAYVTTQAIRCADELILNKRDLYVPGHWERFRAGIVEQNPYARLWETSHAPLGSTPFQETDSSHQCTFWQGTDLTPAKGNLPSHRHHSPVAWPFESSAFFSLDQDDPQRTRAGEGLFPIWKRAGAARIPICTARTVHDYTRHVARRAKPGAGVDRSRI